MTETNLFTPLRLREITLRNRIAVSPMCQYSSEDGFASDWHMVHLGSRAVGGASLVMMEATAVEPRGRISPGDNGLWKDEHIAMLSRITAFIKEQGAAPGIQIAHAGRKASVSRPWEGDRQIAEGQGGWQTVAPSPIPFHEGDASPRALDTQEIAALAHIFADTAQRALAAGFEVLEIHAAHGYLIHEFLSPLANKRTDGYGGSFDHRVRLLLEVTDKVRAAWPQRLPLLVRLSATDWTEGGWTIEDSVKLSGLLKQRGVDLIDCSSGGIVPHARIPVAPGYQVPLAQRIRQEAGIMTGAVGLITEAKQADEIIRSGQADLMLLARAMLRDPYWALHAARELDAPVPGPIQYGRA